MLHLIVDEALPLAWVVSKNNTVIENEIFLGVPTRWKPKEPVLKSRS